MQLKTGLVISALCLLATPAWAGGPLGISEIRGGVMMDDVELYSHFPIWAVPRPESFNFANVDTASIDVLWETPNLGFNKPDWGYWSFLLNPRPELGIDLNLKHESMAHASLNWHAPLFDTPFFIDGELGGVVHNGTLTGAVAPMRNLGCRALFYWSIDIGYQINENWNIMATEQHASQDGLCGWSNNQGLNYEGIRIGYKF
ncbi:MAG TPA: acyloxyacyl hydrolase [Devosiaceae bacterium]|nr:acyloxyacyl hydrolase [Devosiaceae bacterium]